MTEVAPGSLVVLRLPSVLMAAAVVLLAGMTAQRLGARRDGQVFAAACTALTGFVLGMGHLLSTSTADLLGWTLLAYLLLRLLQGDPSWLWLLVGLVAGLTLQANVLAAFLLFGVAVGLWLVGPRAVLLSAGPWAAGVLAVLLALPYLVWQGRHGWPQLEVAANISEGGSGTSASRLVFLPLLVLQAGPWLLPVWYGGLRRLRRDLRLRSLGVAFLVLVVVFLVTGGKPYYVAGLFPVLLAAGAQPFLDRVRRRAVVLTLLLTAPVLVVALPVLPIRWAGSVVPVNYDAGETIGWPQLVDQVSVAYHDLPAGTAVVAGNYGLAGAVDRYGPSRGLPRAYSGHNGYGYWGSPPGQVTVLAVGIDPSVLRDSCREVRDVGRLANAYGIDNDENGTHLRVCVPRAPWSQLWPRFQHLG
jgi:4-amino-4-deoxy-L-arabinose transferase-like glycosyltransferase